VGILSRMSTIFKAKMNQVLDRLEDPRQTLEYSYQRQLELLQNVKRGLADVVASKKRLELQAEKLKQQVAECEEQAKQALAVGREDLARLALERKQLMAQQLEGLGQQIADLQKEQDKLTAAEQRLQAKVEAFRTQKEVIKAQYTAAQATVKIGEAATGLSEEMADVGLTMQRAQEKTEAMRARAAAIDELVAQGTLQDALQVPTVGPSDPVAAELAKAKASAAVESDLARLKAEVARASQA
jgi:phage shock protein A